MGADYKRREELQRLWVAAQGFGVSRLPNVLVMTDPRAPEPDLALWPGPVGVIYRHFGANDRVEAAHRLRQTTFAGGHTLLIGDDPELAVACGADGVHLRRNAGATAARLWRARCPDWLITMAGRKSEDTFGDTSGNMFGDASSVSSDDLSSLDGLLVSSVFPSDSPTAGTPIGPQGLMEQARRNVPLYALGGINARTIQRLVHLPIAGVAGVSFRETPMDDLSITRHTHGSDIRLVATHPDFPNLEAELDLKGAGEGTYAATHTGVPGAMEGKGVGSALFQAMVADAREHGYTVIPSCPFIAAKYKRKPDTRDTLAERAR